MLPGILTQNIPLIRTPRGSSSLCAQQRKYKFIRYSFRRNKYPKVRNKDSKGISNVTTDRNKYPKGISHVTTDRNQITNCQDPSDRQGSYRKNQVLQLTQVCSQSLQIQLSCKLHDKNMRTNNCNPHL